MDSDGPLKLLFQKYAQDLLPLTGDAGAQVERAGPVEIHAMKRQADCVLSLERNGERYYRHVEFQTAPDPEMATRCFQYNTQLILQYGAAVITTVLYLLPPKPKREPVFRVLIGGREVNRWVFEEVCLFELDARAVVAGGAPGLLALVPLMRGGSELASRFYTVSELARIVARDRMWEQSSLYVEGKAEGRLEHARETCVAHARKYHPAVFHRVEAIIAACDDSARLKEWALAASDLNDDGFVELVSIARP